MGAMSRKPDRIIQRWETVAVTALPPGWRNAFRDDGQILYTPCPALLLQEHRASDHCWDIRQGDVMAVHIETRRHEQPYETRVAFADFDQTRHSDLTAATETGNYLGPVPPGEEWS